MLHVIVADGHAVRVLETDSKGAALDEIVIYRNQVGRHERDLVTARPGGVINRAAGIRLLPVETRVRIRAEIARDLVHQPKVALRKRLQPVVRAAGRTVLQSSIVPSRIPRRSST